MKRDLDLIRYILLTTEQSDKGVTDSVLLKWLLRYLLMRQPPASNRIRIKATPKALYMRAFLLSKAKNATANTNY